MLSFWFPSDNMPTLTGERVVLRAPRRRDYEAWFRVRRASREFLKPFEPRWTESDLSRATYLNRLKRGRQEASRGTDYAFFVFLSEGKDEELVGGVTLSNVRRRAAQFGNLGYWMSRDHAGQGLMTESVGLVVRFAFDKLGLHRLHAAFLPGNDASRRVLEKNGFREEGFAEGYLQIDGRWCDHVLYGLTRERHEDWRHQ